MIFYALKEEALKVEMAMQKLAIEQVKQERAEAEERLKEAVRKTEVRAHQELVEAVEKARDEERKIAAAEAVKVAKYVMVNIIICVNIVCKSLKWLLMIKPLFFFTIVCLPSPDWLTEIQVPFWYVFKLSFKSILKGGKGGHVHFSFNKW